jgi:hypothetical protein
VRVWARAHGVGMKHNSTSRPTRDRRRSDGVARPNKRPSNTATHRAELPGLAGLALALAVGGLSACGGDAPGPMTPAIGDATPAVANASAPMDTSGRWVCDLISTVRLQAAFGHMYANGEPAHHDMPAMDQCVWSNTDEGVAIFSLTVASGEQALDSYALIKDMAGEAVAIDVGDDAYRVKSNLSVVDGDVVYQLNAVGAEQQATWDATVALAEELVAR